MSNAPIPPAPIINPRPGVLKALGICNIVFAALSMICILSSAFWYIAASGYNQAQAKAKAEVKIDLGPSTGAAKPGVPMIAAFNPFMGMDDRNFVRFSLLENGTGLLTNGLMFATGIGLLNLRRWGVRWWGILAWVKIGLAVGLWGYYIVGVAPGFSESMAKNVASMFSLQGIPANRAPSVADLTRVYSIMNLMMALGAMTVGSTYPVISLILLGRPRVKAAIVDLPLTEAKRS